MASPATARASNVLPVPGGPTNNTPFGILAPKLWNFLGLFKKSISSATSSFSSSNPATSLNVTFLLFSDRRALLFPKSIDLLAPPICLVIIKNAPPIRMTIGNTFKINNKNVLESGSLIVSNLNPCLSFNFKPYCK